MCVWRRRAVKPAALRFKEVLVMMMVITLVGLTTSQQHVQSDADDGDRSHWHASHVQVDYLRSPVVDLPDEANDNAHDGKETILGKQ